MRKELTFEELDSQQAELLPARETLSTYGHHHGGGTFANIWASNSSTAFNVDTDESFAHSTAMQYISVR